MIPHKSHLTLYIFLTIIFPYDFTPSVRQSKLDSPFRPFEICGSFAIYTGEKQDSPQGIHTDISLPYNPRNLWLLSKTTRVNLATQLTTFSQLIQQDCKYRKFVIKSQQKRSHRVRPIVLSWKVPSTQLAAQAMVFCEPCTLGTIRYTA